MRQITCLILLRSVSVHFGLAEPNFDVKFDILGTKSAGYQEEQGCSVKLYVCFTTTNLSYERVTSVGRRSERYQLPAVS